MTLTIDDTLVGLAGDWHGSSHTVGPAVAAFASRNINHVFHLGDFGFFNDVAGDEYLAHVERICKRHDVTLYVTPGNHENWRHLDDLFTAAEHDLVWFSPHVAALPRGFRATVAGKTFLSMGGASSVDRAVLTPFTDWWPTELITDDHIQAAIADGPADVMLTHESPNFGVTAVQRIVNSPSWWPPEALQAASKQRLLMTELWFETRPDFLAHGHYHVAAHEAVRAPWGQETVVMALNKQDRFGNLATLDLTGATPEAKFITAKTG